MPVLGAALVFAWIAAAVAAPGLPALDLRIREAVHAAASPGLTRAALAVTQLGGDLVLWPLGGFVVLWLMRAGRRREAGLFLLAVLGGDAVNEAMKLIFHRARPEPFFGYPKPFTYSFPSGHAFVSLCFYLTLGEIVAAGRAVGLRRALWGSAVLLALAIGLTRIYLGVHYPSDVAAGYAGAAAWLWAVGASGVLRTR
ncbi:MAG: phosphatase PAP2 family protein [Acidobacteriota bacterium]|nr:phosphatase PAP2 family protein [Acidobacteriota bacterium]